MAISDWMTQGLADKQIVRILTVDPTKRRVEGALKDGTMIQIKVWEVPTVFRWPKTEEMWTVRRDHGFWSLDARLENNHDGLGRIEDIAEGETKITGATLIGGNVTIDGDLIVTGDAGAPPQTVAGFFRSPSPFAVANNTWVRVTYGTTGYNLGSIFDAAGARFLIPEDGIYTITLKGVFESDTTGYRALGVYRNELLDMYENQNPVNGTSTEFAITYDSRCLEGDRIEFYLWQNSGGTLSSCFAEGWIHGVGGL
jgi:hypothetical protein